MNVVSTFAGCGNVLFRLRLLRYLVSNPDRPVSRDMLIESVWGYGSDIGDDRTIDVHIRNLRAKIEADPSSPHYIETVYGAGYRFTPQRRE